LKAIASVQPYHAIYDGCWAARRIGAARLETSYPCRTFLDHGVRLAVFTGKGRRTATITLEELGIAHYFEMVVT
jgi:hypothetical protein